jgi:hypothetical protein
MSSPQAPGASSPRPAGQLQDAMTTFSDAVFEATQGLLNAQQQLTRALLSGDGAPSEADVEKERSNGSDEQETDRFIADEGDDEYGEYGEDQNEPPSSVADDRADDETDETDETDELGEADELDEADELGEADDNVGEHDVEPAAGQTGGDTGAAPAAKAGGRPRRARRPRQAAGTMTSGVN